MKTLLKARYTLATALVLVTGLVGAEALRAQPRATVTSTVIDAGLVVRGESSEHVFEILNEGDRPLEVLDVDPACGCTVVDYAKEIAPGASGRLVATLNTKGLRGAVSRSIEVFTNDPRNAQIDLVIKANVRAYVEAAPGYARFLAVLGQGADAIKQTIYSDEPGDLVVTKVTSPYPFIEVSAHEAPEDERLAGRPGRQWVVETTLLTSAPEGPFADFIDLDLDHPRLKHLRIPVSGFIKPVVAVLPRVADFGRKELTTAQTAILEVKNLGKPDVTLGVVETNVAGLTPTVEVVDEGRLFRLRLTLDPSMPKGDFRGTLTIPTSSELQPEVTIDVRGTIL